jgi:hypothetical protein
MQVRVEGNRIQYTGKKNDIIISAENQMSSTVRVIRLIKFSNYVIM